MPVLSVSGLTKTYPKFKLNNVSFKIYTTECFGIQTKRPLFQQGRRVSLYEYHYLQYIRQADLSAAF